ncbi:metal-dependent hydrolase [Microbacterium sp. bgisy189]|uniref:metal-dependent hydrolase n=1 Tax=Microbacterium sp. bgisy189 TaxID=3413798 RepID=UPI003EBAAD03
MAIPDDDTRVTYPDGDTASTGTVLHVEPLDGGRVGVILDRTAFHPVDTAWPDQPADRGRLRFADTVAEVVDAVTGGIHEGVLRVGADLPVRMATEGWTFVVVHILEGDAPAVGDRVDVEVDAAHRTALSIGHTACHLASLALDAALADAWTKPVGTDAFGNPGFDAAAIQTSRIHPHGSVDVYRIGKSLRRKGFTATALDDMAAVEARANALLTAWAEAGGPVHIRRDDDRISARRTWVCESAAGTAEIPCGGTHTTDLHQLRGIAVTLETVDVVGGREVTMTTTVPAV